jgi:hypothetical protein
MWGLEMERSNSKSKGSRRNLLIAVLLIPALLVTNASADIKTLDQVVANKLSVDNLQLDGNSVLSTSTNGDIILNPNGTGGVLFNDLTATTVPYLDANKELNSSAATPTQLGYLANSTSNLCGINQACTETNKSIDADTNTITNIENADIKSGAAIARNKLASGSNSHVLINDGSGVMTSEATLAKSRGGAGADMSSVTFPSSGSIAVKSGDTFTSPTLTTPVADVVSLTEQSSAPSSPSAGTKKFYAKNDGKLYTKNSAGTETEVGAGGAGGSGNVLTNASFEDATATTGWTITTSPSGGGSAACSEDTADYVNDSPTAAKSLSCTLTSASGKFLEQCKTIVQSGLAFENTLYVKTSLSNVQVCSSVNGTEYQCVPVGSNGVWAPSTPTSITTAAQTVCTYAKSTTAISGTVKFDAAFQGLSRGNDSGAIVTGRTAYTPNASVNQGFGTITGQDCGWTRVGPKMQIDCRFTTGTVAASEARIALPDGYTTATTPATIQLVGGWGSATNGAFQGAVLNEPSKGYVTFGQQGSSANTLTKLNGSTAMASTTAMSFFAEVPITGWESSGNTARGDTQALSWSGYHDNTCSWAITSTTFTDPSADATCALTELTNMNFGTVTSQLSGSDKLPGILYTPARTGRFFACAQFKIVSGSAGQISAALTDGSNNILSASGTRQNSTDNFFNLCGIYSGTANTASTLKIRFADSAGTSTLSAASLATGTRAINWQIFAIDQALPAPFIPGSFFAPYSGTINACMGTITNSGTPAISTSLGSCAASLVDNGTGDTTVTFAANTFSGTPFYCDCTNLIDNTGPRTCKMRTLTSSAVRFLTTTEVDASTGTDNNFTFACWGPK